MVPTKDRWCDKGDNLLYARNFPRTCYIEYLHTTARSISPPPPHPVFVMYYCSRLCDVLLLLYFNLFFLFWFMESIYHVSCQSYPRRYSVFQRSVVLRILKRRKQEEQQEESSSDPPSEKQKSLYIYTINRILSVHQDPESTASNNDGSYPRLPRSFLSCAQNVNTAVKCGPPLRRTYVAGGISHADNSFVGVCFCFIVQQS